MTATVSLPPRVTIARSIVTSVDTVAVSVRHRGAEYVVVVSVERSDLSAADILLLPDAPTCAVAAITHRAALRSYVHAMRARGREDHANYALLNAVSQALRGYSAGWTAASADDAVAEQEEVRRA
jgi:hypothetical protein